MADKLFSLEYGVAGVCVMLTIMVLVQVAKFVLSLRAKKETVTDEAIHELTETVARLERAVSDLPKFKVDVQRFYTAIKHISGDKWPAIRDEILQEERLQKQKDRRESDL